jgi:hypothetical protein
METGYWLQYKGSILGKEKYLLAGTFRSNPQTHSSSYTMGTGEFPEVKQAGREAFRTSI